MKLYGPLENAEIEALSSDPSSTTQGRVWYNTTTARFMLDDGTTKSALLRNDQKAVFGTSATAANNVRFQRGGSTVLQVVSGSDTTAEGTLSTSLAQVDFREPNFTFSGKPAAGNTGRMIYVTDRSALYVDTGSTWSQVGSGGGGSKNYLGTVNGNSLNGDFELQATTGWSKFTTTLTSKIPTGTISAGAASITTFAAQNTIVLGGTYSLQVGSTTALVAGQGFISDAFTIDAEDKSKVLSWSFFYQNATGASEVSYSGNSSGTWAVYIYDVTNAVWIQPAGVYNLVQSSGVGQATGSFQTSSNGTQYRLAVLCINSSAGSGTSTYFDDFKLGPQTLTSGVPVTDWVPYTPTITGFGTVSGVAAASRRVGDTLECSVAFISGTPTHVLAKITLGYNGGNGNVFSSTTLGSVVLGTGAVNVVAAAVFFPISENGSANFVYMGVASGGTGGYASGYGDQLAANGQVFSFFWRVPIQGWSSNVTMSSDTDNRVVAMSAYNASGTSLSGSTTASTITTMTTVDHDSLNGYNPTTGAYTIGVSGIYFIQGGVYVQNSATAQNITLALNKNGSNFTTLSNTYWPASGGGQISGSFQMKLNAGDVIKLTSSSTVTSYTFGYFSDTHFIVSRLSGPAVVGASESVVEVWNTASADVFGASGTIYPLLFPNKEKSTHSAFNGSTFTAPVSGNYRVTANVMFNALGTGTTLFDLFITPSSGTNAWSRGGTGAGLIQTVNATKIFYLMAGQSISFNGRGYFTGTAPTLWADSSVNYISIEKVGS